MVKFIMEQIEEGYYWVKTENGAWWVVHITESQMVYYNGIEESYSVKDENFIEIKKLMDPDNNWHQ